MSSDGDQRLEYDDPLMNLNFDDPPLGSVAASMGGAASRRASLGSLDGGSSIPVPPAPLLQQPFPFSVAVRNPYPAHLSRAHLQVSAPSTAPGTAPATAPGTAPATAPGTAPGTREPSVAPTPLSLPPSGPGVFPYAVHMPMPTTPVGASAPTLPFPIPLSVVPPPATPAAPGPTPGHGPTHGPTTPIAFESPRAFNIAVQTPDGGHIPVVVYADGNYVSLPGLSAIQRTMVAETVRRFLQHHHQQEQLQHQQHQQLQQQLRLQQQQQYGEQQGQQRLHAPEPPLPNQIHARHAQVLAHAAHARMQAQRARSQAQRAGAQAHGEQAEQSPPQLQIQQVHLPVQTPAGAPSASPSAPISLSSESPRTSTQAGMTVDPRAVQVRTAQMGPVQPQFDHMRLGLPPEFGRPHTEPQSELERRQFIVAQQATLGVANGAVPGPVGLSVLPAQPQQPLTAEHTAPPSPLLAPTPLIHATHGRDLTPGFALAPPPQLQSAERPPTPDLHSTPARSSLPLPPPPPLLAEENDISASRFGTLHGFLSAGPSLLLTIGDNSFNLQPTQLDQHSGFSNYGYAHDGVLSTDIRRTGARDVHVSLTVRFLSENENENENESESEGEGEGEGEVSTADAEPEPESEAEARHIPAPPALPFPLPDRLLTPAPDKGKRKPPRKGDKKAKDEDGEWVPDGESESPGSPLARKRKRELKKVNKDQVKEEADSPAGTSSNLEVAPDSLPHALPPPRTRRPAKPRAPKKKSHEEEAESPKTPRRPDKRARRRSPST